MINHSNRVQFLNFIQVVKSVTNFDCICWFDGDCQKIICALKCGDEKTMSNDVKETIYAKLPHYSSPDEYFVVNLFPVTQNGGCILNNS